MHSVIFQKNLLFAIIYFDFINRQSIFLLICWYTNEDVSSSANISMKVIVDARNICTTPCNAYCFTPFKFVLPLNSSSNQISKLILYTKCVFRQFYMMGTRIIRELKLFFIQFLVVFRIIKNLKVLFFIGFFLVLSRKVSQYVFTIVMSLHIPLIIRIFHISRLYFVIYDLYKNVCFFECK